MNKPNESLELRVYKALKEFVYSLKDEAQQAEAFDLLQEFEFELLSGEKQFLQAIQTSKAIINEIKTTLNYPTCTYCKYARFDEDISVGIPLHLEDCAKGFPNIPEELLSDLKDEEELAYLCNCFELNWNYFGPQY